MARFIGKLISLHSREWLTMLMPPLYFYRRRIEEEACLGEPELTVLAKLMTRGGTAVDIGASVGFYAYAFADIADRVVAFESNPDSCVLRALHVARPRRGLRNGALQQSWPYELPCADFGQGEVLHLAGNLKRTHPQFRRMKTYEVEVRTLDEFDLTDVRFIKADVEGSEREVLDGARVTIARDRPIILLELLSGTYEDPGARYGRDL